MSPVHLHLFPHYRRVTSFDLFVGAHRRPGEKGHDFSLQSGLQHVQGTVNVTDLTLWSALL